MDAGEAEAGHRFRRSDEASSEYRGCIPSGRPVLLSRRDVDEP
jgi:hypothetical protein